MSIPFPNTREKWAVLLFFLFVSGCSSEAGKNDQNPVVPTDSTSTKTQIPEEPMLVQDKIVFFELVNPGLGKVYNLHNQTLIQTLHGQYSWPGEKTELEYYPGDSSLESFSVTHQDFSFPLVHKFFSVNKVKELRFGNATKIRLTWMKRADDNRLQARFKLYRNQDHKWMAYGNPGSFTFPGDGFLEAGGQIPDEDGMVRLVLSTLVKLTYK